MVQQGVRIICLIMLRQLPVRRLLALRTARASKQGRVRMVLVLHHALGSYHISMLVFRFML